MISPPLQTVVRQLRQIVGGPPPSDLSDRELLAQFAESGDGAAFAEIVRRHGPLVLGACRRVLQHQHDAEDAFQATFLVLARRAESVRWQDSVGNWLYEVALRVSLKARTTAGARRQHEREAGAMSRAETAVERSWGDFESVLDEELSRMPAKFRQPLVLCYLQGKTRDEAARELGWSEGAVKGSLERGRDLLRRRLASRGVALSAALFAVALSSGPAPAAVPAPLVTSTVQAVLAGPGAAGVSAHVAALTEGALQTMAVTKLKIAAALLLALGVAGAGAGVAAHYAVTDNPVAELNDPRAADEAVQDREREADKRREEAQRDPDISGTIASIAADGSALKLTVLSRERNEQTIEIKITDKTKFSYFGVDNQRPTVGYVALVWLEPGSKDTAAGIKLGQKQADQDRPALSGKVAEVAKDGKSVTLELPRKKDDDPLTKVDIKFTERTKFIYVGAREDGAAQSPTVGHFAQVWLADGTKDTAIGIRLSPRAFEEPPVRRPDAERRPDGERPVIQQGAIKAIDPAKGTITITIPRDGGVNDDQSFALAKDVRFLNDGVKLSDLQPGMRVALTLSPDRKTVIAIAKPRGEERRPDVAPDRVERPSTNGTIVEVDAAKNTITLNVGVRENFFEDKTFTLPADVKIQAGREANLARADLKKGLRVTLLLADDKKTVTIVRVAIPEGEK